MLISGCSYGSCFPNNTLIKLDGPLLNAYESEQLMDWNNLWGAGSRCMHRGSGFLLLLLTSPHALHIFLGLQPLRSLSRLNGEGVWGERGVHRLLREIESRQR